MPRRSKIELSPETISELENQFYDFIDSLSSSERKKFFGEFLTEEEKMMMYKRLALYWSLLEGYSLAKIQQMIGVTHDTTRVYNKRKNMLSEEFKELVGRIGGGEEDTTSEPEPRSETSYEQPQPIEEPAIAEPVHMEESTNEPVEEAPQENEIIHELDLDTTEDTQENVNQEEHHEEVKEPENPYETHIETREYEGETQVPEADLAPQMEAQPHSETPTSHEESMEKSEDQETKAPQMETETRSENGEENEKEPEEKKSAFKKFFGF